MNHRAWTFQRFNAETVHQHIAGCASWAAFSARWRARQGLPLLHAMDVQYLTPQDFCSGSGRPLPAAEQRRVFRAYVEAAVHVYVQMAADGVMEVGRRRMDGASGDIAFVRATGFVRSFELRSDMQYGREDIPFYAPDGLAPARPFGVPVTSATFSSYWIVDVNGCEDENGDEFWIPAVGDGEWFS